MQRVFLASSTAVVGLLAWIGAAHAQCSQCGFTEECATICSSTLEQEEGEFGDVVCEPLGCSAAALSTGTDCGTGNFTDCELPLEACCLPEGDSCFNLTTGNCASLGGTSASAGASCPENDLICRRCIANPNPCPSGACIETDSSEIFDLFLDSVCSGACNSTTNGPTGCGVGMFSDCDAPIGACTVIISPCEDCPVGPNCARTTANYCNMMGGTYGGDATSCTEAFCQELVVSTPTPSPSNTPTNTGTPTATETPTSTETPTQTPVSQGGDCTDGAQCAAGLFCARGVCCDAPCDGPGETCTSPGRVGECLVDLPTAAPAASLTGLLAAFVVLLGIGAISFARLRGNR